MTWGRQTLASDWKLALQNKYDEIKHLADEVATFDVYPQDGEDVRENIKTLRQWANDLERIQDDVDEIEEALGIVNRTNDF